MTTTAPDRLDTALRMLAIPWQALRTMRDVGTDILGNGLEPFEDIEGGFPLRCCLRDSRVGERLMLIAYSPVDASGAAAPYAETGPIFVHAGDCQGYAEDRGYPRAWMDRPQVFRSYHRDGSIAGGVLLGPGDDRDAAAWDLFADPDVAFVHSRNVIHGCFMLEIRRA